MPAYLMTNDGVAPASVSGARQGCEDATRAFELGLEGDGGGRSTPRHPRYERVEILARIFEPTIVIGEQSKHEATVALSRGDRRELFDELAEVVDLLARRTTRDREMPVIERLVARAPPRSALERANRLALTIREGRNRQVRRMCAAVGLPCLRLIRWRVGDWTLEGLAPGAWRQA